MKTQRFVHKRKKPKTKISFKGISFRWLLGKQMPDEGILFSVLALLVFGWVMVYSSSALSAEARYGDQYFFLKRQLLWSVIGIAGFLIAVNIPFHFVQKNVKLFFGFTMVCLVAVLLFGPEVSGAKRWLKWSGYSFQPSELAKLAIVLITADYLDRRQSRLREFKKGLLPLLIVVGLMLGLILMEPDLGTPVLMAGVVSFLLVLGGAKWRHLFGMGAALFPVLVCSVYFVRYRLDRLLAYLNPFEDPYGTGYQLVQSLMALGSGGIFGQGLGNSKVKISNLPDAHTDFVFAVLGEELGLIGTLLCSSLFLFLCLRGLRIARDACTTFSQLVAAGISLTIGLQAVINMGVASGLFPTKGMPLPFISFGGSSLLFTMVSVGLLANISKQAKESVEKI